MVPIEFLTAEESQKLRQFMDVSNIEDDNAAYDLLVSNGWDLERAVETFLLLGTGSAPPAMGYEGYRLDPLEDRNDLVAEGSESERVDMGNNQEETHANEGESSESYPRAEPLIPFQEQTIPEALASFAINFDERYCSDMRAESKPVFFTDVLPKAVEIAFNQENGKPLLLFINDEYSEQTVPFIQNNLCNEFVCDFLKNNFIVFPWDVTDSSNMSRLLTMVLEANMKAVYDRLVHFSNMTRNNFPLMIIVSRKISSIEVLEVITGSSEPNETVSALGDGFFQFKRDHAAYITEEKKRRLDRELLEKQNAAYKQSLMEDMRRKQEKEKQQEMERQARDDQKLKEEENKKRALVAASRVPAAPESEGPDTITIRFRLPANEQQERLFYKTDRIEALVDFLESKGFFQEEYKFLNSDFPKKDIIESYDLKKTFEEVNWPARGNVFVNMNV